MPAPVRRTGTEQRRFGRTGKPVAVDSKKAAAARSGKGKLYEDNSYVPKDRDGAKRRTTRPKGRAY